MKQSVKDFFLSVFSLLKDKKRVLFEIGFGGFVLVSVSLYLQSCVSSMEAEKFHYHGSIGKCVGHSTVVVDTVR